MKNKSLKTQIFLSFFLLIAVMGLAFMALGVYAIHFTGFIMIIVLTTVIAAVIAYMLAGAIARPVTRLLHGTAQIADGDLTHRIQTNYAISELNELAASFDDMAETIHQRDRSLNVSNEQLAALNKSYIELVGFVAHELKGILASTILNAYSVRDGFLGLVNFKQRRALDSITRNLDYLESTVKNFLNLSRIEKGEMVVYKRTLALKGDIFEPSIEAFAKPAAEKEMTVEDRIDPGIRISGDRDLLQIVANNLIGNAVKYASSGGRMVLGAHASDSMIEVEVYNDGRPLTDDERSKLFKRFSRVQAQQERKVQGTGLGLFITKQIIEKHGGTIRVESREAGNAFIFTIERKI